jgi:hypothetical protein
MIENTEVYGFKHSLAGMRNPKNSWDKSDSLIGMDESEHNNIENIILGDKDKELSQKLTKAGSEHCKHLRLIQVWASMSLPRYIWVEMDTYRFFEKISCSTMHKIISRLLTENDFYDISPYTLNELNSYITLYNNDGDKEYHDSLFMKIKNMLPESYLQERTINTNYQQLLNIYNQRKNHRLPQWKVICEWILELPYFKELTGLEAN